MAHALQLSAIVVYPVVRPFEKRSSESFNVNHKPVNRFHGWNTNFAVFHAGASSDDVPAPEPGHDLLKVTLESCIKTVGGDIFVSRFRRA